MALFLLLQSSFCTRDTAAWQARRRGVCVCASGASVAIGDPEHSAPSEALRATEVNYQIKHM
jgi:hypothetical protein